MATHVVTLSNTIVGVSVLAMPFCFKFCGVFLATLMLILGAVITRLVCHFLLKARSMTKRRTYELLAYHTFGHGGKFIVEITIIGFLMGSLIAFLVVIGDLGPQIVAEIFSIENNVSLRTVVMTGLAVFVALPLGLLRDIESLGSVSTISFSFYMFLVLKILNEGLGSLGSERIGAINYWRPSGVLQCIPIFSMALSCQTQIFSIYDSLPDPSLQKMNEVVKKAVYLCTAFYFSVGFFGYIAFSAEGITGNILLSFGPTWTAQLIKVCFVLSIAFSVPLCIFPCRQSLHSLIFRGGHTHQSVHDMSTHYIPDGKLRALTVLIIGIALIIALLIPNIELVLGLVGSTAGCIICLIFPSAMFIRVTSKHTTERLLAQFVLTVGICIMFLTTYVTLYAVDQAQVNTPEIKIPGPNIMDSEVILDPVKKIENLQPLLIIPNEDEVVKFEPKVPLVKDTLSEQIKAVGEANIEEPPQLSNQEEQKSILKPKTPSSIPPIKIHNEISPPPPPPLNSAKEAEEPIDSKRESLKYEPPPSPIKIDESVAAPRVEKIDYPQHEVEKPKSEVVEKQNGDENNVHEEKSKDFVPEDFLKKLEEHQEEQKKLIKVQKEILAELKEHHEKDIQRDNKPGADKHIQEEAKALKNIETSAHEGESNIKVIDSLKEGFKENVKKLESQHVKPAEIGDERKVDKDDVSKAAAVVSESPNHGVEIDKNKMNEKMSDHQDVAGEEGKVKVQVPEVAHDVLVPPKSVNAAALQDSVNVAAPPVSGESDIKESKAEVGRGDVKSNADGDMK